jgi:hypothetical protein
MAAAQSLVAVQERIEGERPFWTPARSRQRTGGIVRIEQVRIGGLRRRVWIRLNGGRLLLQTRRCRRQIQRPLAATTGKCQRSRTHQDEGPAIVRAIVTSHFKIPNAGRTIQRLIGSGESYTALNFT